MFLASQQTLRAAFVWSAYSRVDIRFGVWRLAFGFVRLLLVVTSVILSSSAVQPFIDRHIATLVRLIAKLAKAHLSLPSPAQVCATHFAQCRDNRSTFCSSRLLATTIVVAAAVSATTSTTVADRSTAVGRTNHSYSTTELVLEVIRYSF